MAIALTFSQSDSGKVFTITDASDLGTEFVTPHLQITYDDELVYDEDLGDWSIGASIDLEADDVGQTADSAFLDGVYTILYTTEDVPAGVSYNTLLDYNVKYCVYNMLRQVPDVFTANPCKDVNVQRALFMYTFLKSLEYSAACGQVNEIENILAKLQILCLKPTINECYCN